MDKKFLQNQRDPNADDFVYDVRVDFDDLPKKDSGWDSD